MMLKLCFYDFVVFKFYDKYFNFDVMNEVCMCVVNVLGLWLGV